MAHIHFNPFPVLHTERLVLRESTLNDADGFFALRSNPDVMKYISKPLAQSLEEIKELIVMYNAGSATNQFINWSIVLHDGSMIGSIGLFHIKPEHDRAEIGYMLHPHHWRKGIISEAMKAVIQYGFGTMQLHSIEANIDPRNEASASILEKHGFVREGYFRESFYNNNSGTYEDAAIYSLVNDSSK